MENIIKPRSYVACLREGLKIPFLHFSELLKLLWPIWLLVTLLVAGIQVAQLGLSHEMLNAQPQAANQGGGSAFQWGLMAALEIVLFILCLLFMGHVVWQQRQLVETEKLPTERPWKVCRSILHSTWRSFVGIVILMLPYLLLLAGLLWGLHVNNKVATIACGVGMLLWIAYVIVLLPSVLEYFYTEKSLAKSFSIRLGFHYWGRTFVVVLLAGLASLLVLFVACLPTFLVLYVEGQVMGLTMMGDVVTLPSYFPVLRYAVLALYALMACFGTLIFTYPLLYHWGAIRAIEQERAQIVEQANEAQ